ncbi:hypothetical protein L3X38_003677 [Prunus dulcis]|uniref:Uncharacterized protein n=1 Tax=Prunus dulcis TaxID=3755 RepID=A0AAD4ZMJ6_PRUDU|nr:hypothetical protein L3X38_003677 [Prunus dulcis]
MSLSSPEPCGARNAAEAYEDCGLDRSGISEACEDCGLSRLGVSEACEDEIDGINRIDGINGIDGSGLGGSLSGEDFSFEMFLN